MTKARVWGMKEMKRMQELDRQVLQVCVEQKKWSTFEADAGEGGRTCMMSGRAWE